MIENYLLPLNGCSALCHSCRPTERSRIFQLNPGKDWCHSRHTLKWMSLGIMVSPGVRVLKHVCLLVPGAKASSGKGGRFSKSMLVLADLHEVTKAALSSSSNSSGGKCALGIQRRSEYHTTVPVTPEEASSRHNECRKGQTRTLSKSTWRKEGICKLPMLVKDQPMGY